MVEIIGGLKVLRSNSLIDSRMCGGLAFERSGDAFGDDTINHRLGNPMFDQEVFGD